LFALRAQASIQKRKIPTAISLFISIIANHRFLFSQENRYSLRFAFFFCDSFFFIDDERIEIFYAVGSIKHQTQQRLVTSCHAKLDTHIQIITFTVKKQIIKLFQQKKILKDVGNDGYYC
jgi:hypothetical protein